MIKTVSFINIRELLSRLLRHPLLQDVTLEQVVQHTIDFISIVGMPKFYLDKEQTVEIKDYRGLLPCDLISINQVKDCLTNICLRSMTDTFNTKRDINKDTLDRKFYEPTFKVQGRVIFTSMKDGELLVSYKAIPIDDEGYPLLVDNPTFLKALELYIKKEVFTVLFDMNRIQNAVLQNTQQQYSWVVGQCASEFTIPSISEMESIKNMWTTSIQRTTDFRNGFETLGNQEYIKVH